MAICNGSLQDISELIEKNTAKWKEEKWLQWWYIAPDWLINIHRKSLLLNASSG